MPLPKAPEAQPFYRAAIKRMEEASFLFDGDRMTASIYLAGYGIECMLKSLIFSATPRTQRSAMLGEFHGRRAHSFDWLRSQYARTRSGSLPHTIARAFTFVNTWDTDLRYETRDATPTDAEDFLEHAQTIVHWVQGRL